MTVLNDIATLATQGKHADIARKRASAFDGLADDEWKDGARTISVRNVSVSGNRVSADVEVRKGKAVVWADDCHWVNPPLLHPDTGGTIERASPLATHKLRHEPSAMLRHLVTEVVNRAVR